MIDKLLEGPTVSFEEIVDLLINLPQSWYPVLLREMIVAAYKKEVFLPNGASRFVAKIEQNIKDGKI